MREIKFIRKIRSDGQGRNKKISIPKMFEKIIDDSHYYEVTLKKVYKLKNEK